MITKATIHNFKCLHDVSIDLERFTIIVGPNASGKSSILQAIHWLSCAFRNKDFDPESKLVLALSRGKDQPVELMAEYAGQCYRYRTRKSSLPGSPTNSSPDPHDGLQTAPMVDPNHWTHWSPKRHPIPLPVSVLLRLETSKLIASAPNGQDPTVMAPDGMGLHTALANMALNDPDAWQELQANLRQIIPTIRRLRHTKTANINQPVALLFDTVGADALSADQVSEGTLLVLGMLTALHSSGRPNLVLLDDLDRGLHPKAQKEFIALLRSLMANHPDLQIIATTHSPYMLDCMEPNEVRMTVLRDDGSTACAPLASHPKFRKWKDEMTPGELWSLFGEQWMIEQGAMA